MDQFTEVAAAVQSRFFTMDMAKRRDGEWMIVELGDAQVAGLPENADVNGFYKARGTAGRARQVEAQSHQRDDRSRSLSRSAGPGRPRRQEQGALI